VPTSLVFRPSWSRRQLAYVGLGAWVALCIVLGGYLLAGHLLTLPTPSLADPELHQAIAANRRSDQRGRWLVLHVLSEDCQCSRRVLDHLLADPRPPGVAERIVLVTDDPAGSRAPIAAIRERGFDLDVVTPDDLVARYHVEAAPLLVIVDPGDAVRYVGGYTPRKQAADIRDVAVIAAVHRGEAVEPLPAFGCAVGRALSSKLDPLGVRTRK
jgi:hypothetical protein